MTDMDLSKLIKKTLQVSRGFTYTYYTSPAQEPKPTLLLFHGWPDTARLWAGLVNDHLVPHGYGVVALDNLGFGETSKPTDHRAYAWHLLSADAVEILDAENLDSVVSLGHDWGSLVAQRLYNFHPSRVRGLVTLNVPYMAPAGHFDLDEVNRMTRMVLGVAIFEYWNFFLADDAVDIMNRNLESVYAVAFGEPETWLENWCSPGGMRRFVSEGRTQPTQPYATPEHKADFMERFGRDGGFAAPRCTYAVTASGVQSESERMLPEEAKTVHVPVLYWGGEQDFVCRPAILQQSIAAGVLPNVKSVTREGGHWAFIERPDDFGRDLLGWLRDAFDWPT
ncbi:Bifunctional epoxide hydrolase 2-like protein 3 [Colletotrichum chlorophyti]|uniref:Bifunctional epoxide hydrolase 2-like protein 3 n=1 Tax=Colletotrichum chlorophyti TaxID=708187 RepID=A0A1Q8RWI1_9PEZI|nr:Bifunctional epoxide hydrolase 2-like protein 3 [Colletotrichum chlorophyti]